MIRSKWFLAGILIALCASALAIDSVGIPSRPKFLSLGVGAAAPATPGIAITTTGTGITVNTSAAQRGFQSSDGTANVAIFSNGASGGFVGTTTPHSLSLFTNGSTGAVLGSGLQIGSPTGGDEGVGTINVTGLFQNGVAPAFYTDSGKNFSGATAPTVGGQAICVANGTNCPASVAQTSGSFTATLATGCTTTPTVTIHWLKVGSMVTLWSNTATAFNCTSNTTQKLTDASVPAAERPSSTRCIAGGFSIEDNTTSALGNLEITSAGVLQFGKQLTGTGASLCGGPNATNAGTFGVDMWTATYDIT